MNKIGIYILLILIYLGLSRGFSLSSKGVPYFKNEKVLDDYFPGAPLSVIMVDFFEAGIFIKTYYHKYKIVSGFNRQPRIITVRASKDFYERYSKYLGMSIFRRQITDYEESLTPIPPGMLYVGDLAYGKWKYVNSGERIWNFYDSYKEYPELFGWGNFRPNLKFFKKMQQNLNNEEAYTGDKGQFGTGGSITANSYPRFYNKKVVDNFTFNIFLSSFITFQSNWMDKK